MEFNSREILNFWFGKVDKEGFEEPGRSEIWFKKSEETDNVIRNRFFEAYAHARDGKLDAEKETAEGALALILLMDQFSRNMFRGTAESFATDRNALSISRLGIAKEQDKELPLIQRYFYFMPYMHSEKLEEQERSLELFMSLIAESEGRMRTRFEEIFGYAQRHYEIVRDYGRFPHRNKILGRESTESEVEFLKQPGSSF